MARGRWHEAVAGYQRALDREPRNFLGLFGLAATFNRVRQYPQAADVIDRLIAVAPDRPTGYVIKHWIYTCWHGTSPQSRSVLEEVPPGVPGLEDNWLRQELYERHYEAALVLLPNISDPVTKSFYYCECYALMNEPKRRRESCEAARVVFEQLLKEHPDDPRVNANIGRVYAYLGARDKAIDHAQRAMELRSVSDDATWGPSYVIYAAHVFARLGELDEALDHVEYALSIPSPLSVADLRLDPRWDPLRDHPRFQEILEKYGEEQ
jgi:tetratricopeptide (TPR) repeat protein